MQVANCYYLLLDRNFVFLMLGMCLRKQLKIFDFFVGLKLLQPTQFMSQLLQVRVKPSKPFTNSGVD